MTEHPVSFRIPRTPGIPGTITLVIGYPPELELPIFLTLRVVTSLGIPYKKLVFLELFGEF